MDTKPPLGSDAGLSPKQLLLAAICGCTAMDVVSFHVNAEGALTEGAQPHIFSAIALVFEITGQLESSRVLEAVSLSQTQYCGVSAMISKAVPISYTVQLNGSLIGAGKAKFKIG